MGGRSRSQFQKADLFEVFHRIGETLKIRELPNTYTDWQVDRQRHIVRDLTYSKHTSMLFAQYRKHLGMWRYLLLLEVQGLLVPNEVRRMLKLNANILISGMVQTYSVIGTGGIQSLVHTLLRSRTNNHALPRLHSQQNDLRRYVETNGHDAGTDTSGDEEIVVVFDDMSARIPLSETRWLDHAADEWKPHLPAVSVSR